MLDLQRICSGIDHLLETGCSVVGLDDLLSDNRDMISLPAMRCGALEEVGRVEEMLKRKLLGFDF